VSTRRNQMAANRLAKRTSLYSVHHQQPSPPSTLSSEDSNERNGTVGVNGDHMLVFCFVGYFGFFKKIGLEGKNKEKKSIMTYRIFLNLDLTFK
jgi:hypothetical protein